MHHWTKRLFALAAPLLLTGCLWGPGKFASDLTLKKDGSFMLDYRGEMVLQLPTNEPAKAAEAWKSEMARCYADGTAVKVVDGIEDLKMFDPQSPISPTKKRRTCTAAEVAKLKSQYDKEQANAGAEKRRESEEMAKMFGLPGVDDASNRAFAAKLMKYAGWRSVIYRGNGVFDVDYHFEGRATQDFLFPALPDNDLLVPFIAIRRRADGSVLVTAPAMTGGAGPIASRMASMGGDANKGGPLSRAQGRFTVITDGEVLTNNSEDGATAHSLGRAVHWDVSPASTKVPETLIRL